MVICPRIHSVLHSVALDGGCLTKKHACSANADGDILCTSLFNAENAGC